jgi:hypothetical protein
MIKLTYIAHILVSNDISYVHLSSDNGDVVAGYRVNNNEDHVKYTRHIHKIVQYTSLKDLLKYGLKRITKKNNENKMK